MKTKVHLMSAAIVTALGGSPLIAQATGAIPVYNQAYQENYDTDKLADILAMASNAYVLLDPFSETESVDWAGSVAALKARGNQVGAYISVGTGEDWRSDFATLKPHLVTIPWDQWAGEYFINSTTDGALGIMKARIDQIADWGFDWVEFDNMDWVYDDEYRAAYGIGATIAEGETYFNALCDYVHQQGMRCMAKNMTEGTENFDGVLYESYSDDLGWWDQAGGVAFVAAGKLVVINHYDEADCAAVYADYRAIYGETLSFICEDSRLRRYLHFNQ